MLPNSQYRQKLLFQFHKHHVPKGESSRSKCNLSQMLFTPNNLYMWNISYSCGCIRFYIYPIYLVSYREYCSCPLWQDKNISIQIRDLNPFSMVRLIYVLWVTSYGIWNLQNHDDICCARNLNTASINGVSSSLALRYLLAQRKEWYVETYIQLLSCLIQLWCKISPMSMQRLYKICKLQIGKFKKFL